MSMTPRVPPARPLIGVVEDVHRALRDDMARAATAAGFPEVRATHDAVFASLPAEGARISAMAAEAGITKQSMAEIVRDLERDGIVRIDPDPTDGRAKLVSYTERGLRCVHEGQQHIDDVEAQLASVLGKKRLAELRRLLGEVIDALAPGLDNDPAVG
ncbi:MarR family transcriptional regulator [Nocardioides immobilis]|uniref:MarR family transcriptional regulator n=2 Tax=Nocardioides immobilis TaxID=2049295 RepID=A0A417XYP7_9ACTN|nr:MarR family transcriptional regulator [Nocardioides immobilis]